MRSGRCSAGITYRAIRQAFADELNSNPLLVARIEKAAGHASTQSFEGAFMTNHGTDLRMIIVTADSSDDEIHLNVQIDSGSRSGSVIDVHTKPKVRIRRSGDHRHVTIAPSLWFQDRANAAEAENMVTFEALMKLASPSFKDALEEGIARAERTFADRMRPKSPYPYWMSARRRRL